MALLWAVVVMAIAAWAGVKIGFHPVINSNFLSMLPPVATGEILDSVERIEKRLQRQLVVLVGSEERSSARAEAEIISKRMLESGHFSRVTLRHDLEYPRKLAEFYYPLRFRLISHALHDALAAGDRAAIENQILGSYFSLQSRASSQLIARDPLLLLSGFLSERAADAPGGALMEDGFLTAREGSKTFVVITAELERSPFSISVQKALITLFAEFKTDLGLRVPEAELLVTGVLSHAIAGTTASVQDISAVGTGSLVGIVVLFVWLFRSWRPLGLSVLSIVVGCIGGLSACLFVFGEVHLLTLAFGSSLVGISVDYSLHYFCERYRSIDNWSSSIALRRIAPAVTLGLLTSLIGFAGLFFAPFPGMQGMALFSSVGLIFAYFCLFAWYPILTEHLAPPRGRSLLKAIGTYDALWRCQPSWLVVLLGAGLMLFLGWGCSQLTVRDDIRLLQQADKTVMGEELRTRAMIGRNLAGQFFIVEGDNEAQHLEREEELTRLLREYRAQGQLIGYIAVSDYVASPTRQAENLRLLAPEMTSDQGLLQQLSKRIGLPDEVVRQYVADFQATRFASPLTAAKWLADPVSVPYRHLYSRRTDGSIISTVHLRGVLNLIELRKVADPDRGIYFVDPAGTISETLAQYRQHTIWLTVLAYIVVGILLARRYGFKGGAVVIAVPLLACFSSLGVLGLIQEPVSLFNVMALLLVLGIGVDYALFFRETGHEGHATFLAIALSCATTLLAFGILAFSRTSAIHSFGLTIAVGIFVAFLLSPLAGRARN